MYMLREKNIVRPNVGVRYTTRAKIFFQKTKFFQIFLFTICVVRKIKWLSDSESRSPITLNIVNTKIFFFGGGGKNIFFSSLKSLL